MQLVNTSTLEEATARATSLRNALADGLQRGHVRTDEIDAAVRSVLLTPDSSVSLQANREQDLDPAGLADVLATPAVERWTEVTFRGPKSQEWLYLWLASSLPGALMRMPADKAIIDAGTVKKPFGWGCMATAHQGDLAYLTLRPADRETEGAQLYEIGVIGHSPGGDELSALVTEQTRTWNQGYRTRDVHFEVQSAGAPSSPSSGHFLLDTPLNKVAVEWQ